MNALLWACTLSVATATTTRGHALASPVAKVVKLLEDMQTDLKAEADKDEENYDKMMCWCATNEKDKTKSIDDAGLAITSLTAEIETRTAKDDQLGKEITKHEASAKSLLEQLDSQAAQRDKEGKANQAKIIDLTKNIMALSGAVTVLKKHQALFFPQIKVEFLQRQLQSIQTAKGPAEDKFSEWMDTHDYGKLSKEDAARVEHYEAGVRKHDAHEKLYDGYTYAEMQTLMKAKKVMRAFAQTDISAPDYANQSGEIFGILTTMMEQMKEDLKELEASEATAKTDYGAMVEELKSQLAAEEENAKRKTAEKVDNGRALSAAKTDLEDNEKTLEADTAFLKNVKETCGTFDKAWEERRKTRAEEILAVSEAIQILTEDDAVDTAKAALGNDGFFLQMKSVRSHTSVRTLAAKALQKVASKTHNPALVQLSAAVQLDGFEQVKKAINEMIADLKQEQADEVKHKDFCNTEFQANEMENISKAQDKKDLIAHIGILEDKNETLTTTKATTEDELAQLKVEIQQANIERVDNNKEFQQTMADQKATRKILGKALDRLQQFYADKALIQKKSHTLHLKKQAPPVQVTEYKKSGGAAGVTVMLENLITETKQLEAEAVEGEKEAQAGYEQFMTESNALMVAKMESIVNLGKELAGTEEDLIQADVDLKNTEDDMEEIAATVADLHSACDFVLKNFGLRQKARGEEIEGLQQALGILSGALN